jgi:hypothetical protein
VRRSFSSGRFRFQVEDLSWLPGLSERLDDEAFDGRLVKTGRVPELHGAPVASWLLARLARITDGGFPSSGKERNDGGGWCVDFVVYTEDGRPVATFQLQGDMRGAAVLGDRAAECPAEEVLQALVDRLVDAPDDLIESRLTVVDREW